MEHKTLIIECEKGEIKEFLLKANLNETYKTLFNRACQSAKRSPNNVGNGIKIVIFGSFWLESYANETMKMILSREITSPALQKTIWERLKKIPLQEKLDLFYRITPSSLRQDYDKIKQNIKDLFDLRNRLAHFKDEPAVIDLDINLDQLNDTQTESNIENVMARLGKAIPVPEINKRLMWPNTQKHAKTVASAAAWLTKVIKISDKTHKLTSRNIKLHKKK